MIGTKFKAGMIYREKKDKYYFRFSGGYNISPDGMVKIEKRTKKTVTVSAGGNTRRHKIYFSTDDKSEFIVIEVPKQFHDGGWHSAYPVNIFACNLKTTDDEINERNIEIEKHRSVIADCKAAIHEKGNIDEQLQLIRRMEKSFEAISNCEQEIKALSR